VALNGSMAGSRRPALNDEPSGAESTSREAAESAAEPAYAWGRINARTAAAMPSTAAPTPFTAARDFLLRHREDYDTAYRDFRWPVLEHFNWALDHFDALARAADTADAIALQIVGEDGSETKRSFRQLSERSSQVANHLRGLGVKRGDRVLLMLGNELALWELMLAAFKLGAVLIPATSLLTTEDLRDRLDRGAVRHVVTASAQAAKFAPLPGDYTRLSIGDPVDGWQRFEDAAHAPTAFVPDAPTRATDPLLLYFTSGTTSKPKLVLHTHQSYPVGHLSTMYWIGLRPGDVHLNISSPGWAKHAWSCFFAPWNAGACIFIYNYARFDAPKLLGALEAHRVTSLCAPPTVWRMLIQHDLAAYRGRLALREVIGAGEPLNPEIIEQVRAAWGLTLRDGYGQTETTAQVGNPPGQRLKPGSMGRPLPGYRIVLIGADDKEADEGEVCLDLGGDGRQRPLGLMDGYLDDAAKSAEVMRAGCYHTGDVAARDADGYITFVGRADDVFKASDYRISPFELESALIEHEAVAEVAIVPSPDPLRMAVPKAFLILVAGAVPGPELAQAIFGFARAQLAPYKRVRRIEFVAELPKTISGKIRRVQLRAQEVERRAAGTRGDAEFFEEDFPALRG
jgi:acetyl-CoA synthetase